MAVLEHAPSVASLHGGTQRAERGGHRLSVQRVGSGMDTVPVLEALRERKRLLSAVEERAETAGVPFVRAVRESEAVACTVTEYAEEVHRELLMVDTRGRGSVSRWLLSSVAERIVRTVKTSALPVRGPGEE